MKKLLLLVLILLVSNAYAQEKKIKKAIEALNENNLEDCYKYLEEYTLSASAVPLATYVEYLINTKKESPNYNIEKGFEKIQIVSQWMSSNTPDKGWCKSFGLCEENLVLQIDSLALKALKIVESNKSDKSYLHFIKTYINTPINKIGVISYHQWKFEVAISHNSVSMIEEFINQFPTANEVGLAKQKIEDLEYSNCIKSNDISILKVFLTKYPYSSRNQEIQQKLIDLEFKKCDSQNDKKCFVYFLQNYPNSQFTLEVKNKIEEIDFKNTEKNAKKEILEAFILDYPNSKYIAQVKKKLININNESILVSGFGNSRESAINNCVYQAINLVTNMYINSETIIVNEKLIKETIKQIGSSEILEYEIIKERIIDENNFEITLKFIIKTDTLVGFFKSNGMILNFDKNSFTYKLKNHKVKEEQEIEIIYDLIGNLNEGLQTSFDYKMQAFSPIVSSTGTNDWKIPLRVFVLPNENFKNNFKLLFKTLETLSLSELEIEEYKKYSKKIYPVKLYSAGSLIDFKDSYRANETSAKIAPPLQTTYYLRNRNSLKAINFLFNNYFNFLTSFNITNEIDTLNGLNIECDYQNMQPYYLSDPTISRLDISGGKDWREDQLKKDKVETKRDGSIDHNNLKEFLIPTLWINPFKSLFYNPNYNQDEPIYEIQMKNLLEIDTLAIFNMNHFVHLANLKKISNYKIKSNGLIYKYREKGMILKNNMGSKKILLLNYFDKLPFTKIDSTFSQPPFNKLTNLRIPNDSDYYQIYSSPYYKLLILPNYSWCNAKNPCYSGSTYIYTCYVDEVFRYFKRYHGTTCHSMNEPTNIVLIYEK